MTSFVIKHLQGIDSGFYYWDGSQWQFLGASSSSSSGGGSSSNVKLGDLEYGGVVYYLLQEGDYGYVSDVQNGLVVAEYGCGCDGVQISGTNATDGATLTIIGSGAQNTAEIVAAGCTTSDVNNVVAAEVCDSLSLNGYTDWYLGAQGEMEKLYYAKEIVQLGGAVPIESTYYWTSSNNGSNAYGTSIRMSSLSISTTGGRDNTRIVRCIRSY